MREFISKTLVKSLQAKDKPYEVRDTRLRGLVLRIQKTGSMTYYLAHGRGKRIRLGPGSIDPDVAREIAIGHLASLSKGQNPTHVQNQAKRLTFLQFIESDEYKAWAEGQLRTYEKLVQRLKGKCKALHNKRLTEITVQDFEKLRASRLKDGKKRATTNRDLDDVRGVLSKAVSWGYIDANPLASVKKLKVDKNPVVRFLSTIEEQRLFLALDAREQKIRERRATANEWRAKRNLPLYPTLHNAAFADHLKPMVLTALHTGIRQGELFDIRWKDIDLDRAQLVVRGEKSKNLQTRFIPLNATALNTLCAWRDQCGDIVGLVFPGKDNQRFDNIKSAWKALLKNANISDFRWHDLRHNFASQLVMRGVDLNTVRELMGHSDYQMTLRYSHLAPEHKINAVAKLVTAA